MSKTVDIVIIGAGTAGLTASIYAQRGGKSALMLEQLAYGGQIINTTDIENYPGLMHVSGFDYATKLYEQAMELGAEIEFTTVLSVEDQGKKKIVRTAAGDFEASAVIVATGAKNRPLAEEGSLAEEEERLKGKGLSYCAVCDGMFYRGKNVAVVGGGNTALDDALFLSNVCRSVTLIHRRNEFRGSAKDLKKLQNKENVTFMLSSKVTKVLGEDSVRGIEVTNIESGAAKELAIDGLFVAVGQMPDNRSVNGLVELENGYIKAGEDCTTKTPGIFAAGDCRTKEVRQLTTAAADGAVAGLAAVHYVEALNE